MLRQSLRGFAVAVVAAFTLGPAPAAAVTLVDSCRILDKAGETYVLTANIVTAGNGACFFAMGDRITLDLAGHTVDGIISGPNQGVLTAFSQTLVVVKNGTFKNFQFGVLAQGTRATIRNVTATDNTVGILVGASSLVKDCTAQRNGSGVLVRDNGQVEGCLIEDNGAGLRGGGGLFGGQRMLITRNIVRGNGVGINVDSSSTVTHNTSNENALDGIVVGQKSLVSYNTANDNGGDGIQVVCPSTVTNNQASNNVDNFNLIDVGGGHCFDNGTNTSPDENGCRTGDTGLADC